jgi:putative DNA primase/helicase
MRKNTNGLVFRQADYAGLSESFADRCEEVDRALEVRKKRSPFQQPALSSRALIVQCAADVKPEPVSWLWAGRVALGKQTLLAGQPGLGKSQVALAVVAAVTTGGPWPCGEGHAPLGSALILVAEDGAADTLVPRLMAAGADLKRVSIINAVGGSEGRRTFNLQSDIDLLEREIKNIGDVQLVVIDPVSSYLGGNIDSHINAAVRGVLEPLSEMAERLRVAVICVTHQPKVSVAAINSFIGSIGFVAVARAAFMVVRDPQNESRRLFLPVKNNLAPLGRGLAFRLEQRILGEPSEEIIASSVAWESAHVDVTADQALQSANELGGKHGRERERSFLRNLLANGPVAMRDVKDEADGAGLSWASVRRAKDDLGVESKKVGMEQGWVWQLPKMLRNAEDAHIIKVSTFGPDEHLQSESDRSLADGPTRPRLNTEAWR